MVLAVATSSGAVVTAESATSADDLGDVPLSAEDLALLDALATTSTPAPQRVEPNAAPSPGPNPTRRYTRAGLIETQARTVPEAIAGLPTVGWSHRGVERATVLYDGVELEPSSSGAATFGWLGTDPRFFGAVGLAAGPSLSEVSDGGQASVTLESPTPALRPEAEVAANLHSADRSNSTFVFGAGALGPGQGHLGLSYLDTRPLRIAPDVDENSRYGQSQRWNGTARLHLFGGTTEGLRLTAGGDLDRLQNQVLYDALGRRAGRDEVSQRHLAFLRFDWSDARGEAFLVGAHQGLRRERTEESGATRLDRSDQLQLRGRAHYRLIGDLHLGAGGIVAAGPSRGLGYTGRSLRAEGWASLEFLGDSFRARAGGRFVHRKIELDGVGVLNVDRPLGEVGLELGAAQPLAVQVVLRQGLATPSIETWYRVQSRAPNQEAETNWTLEVGPRLQLGEAWLNLVGFYQSRSGALVAERLASPTVDLEVLGLEFESRVPVGPWTFALAAAWADPRGPDGRPVVRAPALEFLGSVRHGFEFRDAYFEVHLRAGTSGLHVLSTSPGFEPSPYLRLGLRAGMDLGWGLRLGLAVENALDRPIVFPDTVVPSPGLDVAATLSWDPRW